MQTLDQPASLPPQIVYNVRMNQVTCDNCNQQFQPQAQAEKTTTGEIQYVLCPHCGHRFDYAVVTQRGIELRAKLQRIAEQLKTSTDPRLRKRYNKTLSDYQAQVSKP